MIRLGEPIPENKKVRDFLHGIYDPQCSNIKLSVLANATFMNDSPQAVNYIASAIDMMTKNTSSTTACQISEVNSGRHQFHQGGNYGRGGRNHHHVNESTSENVTRSYSIEEWQNLSAV